MIIPGIDRKTRVPNLTAKHRHYAEVAESMNPGDSVFVTTRNEKMGLLQAIRMKGFLPTERSVDGGFRIWKTEKRVPESTIPKLGFNSRNKCLLLLATRGINRQDIHEKNLAFIEIIRLIDPYHAKLLLETMEKQNEVSNRQQCSVVG